MRVLRQNSFLPSSYVLQMNRWTCSESSSLESDHGPQKTKYSQRFLVQYLRDARLQWPLFRCRCGYRIHKPYMPVPDVMSNSEIFPSSSAKHQIVFIDLPYSALSPCNKFFNEVGRWFAGLFQAFWREPMALGSSGLLEDFTESTSQTTFFCLFRSSPRCTIIAFGIWNSWSVSYDVECFLSSCLHHCKNRQSPLTIFIKRYSFPKRGYSIKVHVLMS